MHYSHANILLGSEFLTMSLKSKDEMKSSGNFL